MAEDYPQTSMGRYMAEWNHNGAPMPEEEFTRRLRSIEREAATDAHLSRCPTAILRDTPGDREWLIRALRKAFRHRYHQWSAPLPQADADAILAALRDQR